VRQRLASPLTLRSSDSSSAYPSCLTPLLNNTASRGTFLSDQIHISAATVDVDAELLLPETPAFIDGGTHPTLSFDSTQECK
jgi:hypothetical protein